MGGFSSAADLYGRAVEAGDGSYRPMLGRAQARVKAGRAEDAWKELQARVEKTPGSASSWQAMALFLMHSQRWSEASPCLASALAKYPRSRSLRQLAGVCALGQRDYTAAVQHFTAVRNEGEKDPMLPVYRYVALAHTAGVEQARETVPEVKDAAQIRHNLWPTPLLRSCAGGLDAAVLLRSAARRVGPEQSASQVTQAHYLLGEMALLAGDKDGALRHWSECVKSGDGRSLPGLLANQLIHLLVP
jgi:tetratricopeptide (TPR) repeat protein